MDNKWVSCKERLPKKDGKYLVTKTFDFIGMEDMITTSAFVKGGFLELTTIGKVIAWMELPQIYKETNGD